MTTTLNLQAQEADRTQLLGIHDAVLDSLDDLDQYAAYEAEMAAGHCTICDGLGHGFPGGGPCPLEETGEQGVPWWAQ